MLIAMMRKQKISIGLQKQELHSLRQRRDATETELEHRYELCRETERYLALQVVAGQEILFDRLKLAQLRHSEQQDFCIQVEQHFKRLTIEVEQKEKTIAYAEKALEKFADLLTRRKVEAHEMSERSEWRLLDEWATHAKRRRA